MKRTWTMSEARAVIIRLFNEVAPDLGVDDVQDEAFQDYAGDAMADLSVPHEMIEKALEEVR